MAKLIFKYGVMNSGKTTTLLMIAHDYERRNKKILIGKPRIDTKGGGTLQSRLNNNTLVRKVDFLIDDKLDFSTLSNVDVVLVDEAHFLNREQVNKLAQIVAEKNIPVICFGLKVDFRGEPFEGSSHLFALANRVEEIGVKAICACGSIANMNLLTVANRVAFNGAQIQIDDGTVDYSPVCLKCYLEMRGRAQC